MEALGYNIYDINDPFYTDICTPCKSSGNTDVLLSDRRDYIFNNEDTLCQAGCKFSNYINGTNYINCTCETKRMEEEEDLEKKIDKMDAKTFSESFYYVNIRIIKSSSVIS